MNFTKIEDWNKRFHGISFRSSYSVQQYLGETVWKVKHYIRKRTKYNYNYVILTGKRDCHNQCKQENTAYHLVNTFTTVKRENNFKVNILLSRKIFLGKNRVTFATVKRENKVNIDKIKWNFSSQEKSCYLCNS